ncbi:hypothetical protein [Marinomonas posidonica]|uniref:Uncharacterized protein n=1 Tax=Marinomonas posidonica (strain CECT 7376 / NCIMB 14433 / IVIA-Po-181) TaxID=491952 RepID=F6CVF3_MARPP|nr:hypothetical protein [Marinomonas posidonica]AEF54263.1 hypothetical protein Mar181_1216 [Marinomonas posidonica IVIA-Po-181]
MIKKHFLNTYKKINQLNPNHTSDAGHDTTHDEPSANIYRSKKDEKLIKDFHYAKFQENLNKTKKNNKLKELIEKEDWNEEDVKALLDSLN